MRKRAGVSKNGSCTDLFLLSSGTHRRKFCQFRYNASVRLLISAFLLLAVLTGCKRNRGELLDLRARIINAKTSQDCHPTDACFNPIILVVENGYDVTTFAGNRPQHVQLRPEALREHLVALPMVAWPRGPMILITPSDVVTDAHALRKNLEEAKRICRSLSLDVEFRPGG